MKQRLNYGFFKYYFVLSILIVSGCGSVISGKQAYFDVDSVPSGAVVKDYKGRELGVTPLKVRLPRRTSQNTYKLLTVEAPNYRKAKIKIKPEFNNISLLNFLFIGFSLGLPSFTTDSLSNNLYKFKESSYVVELKPSSKPSTETVEDKEVEQSKPSASTSPAKDSESLKKLEKERARLAEERAKVAAEKAELERLKLEAERMKLEEERRAIQRQKEEIKSKLKGTEEHQDNIEKQEKISPPDTLPPTSPIEEPEQEPIEETPEDKEERLLEKMKQKYQRQLDERRQKKKNKNVPNIEVNPLSTWENSPSYGALPLTIAQYRLVMDDLLHGGGESLEEIFIRLSLAHPHQSYSSQTVAYAYPRFVRLAQQQDKVLTAPHGLALFRALKPVHQAVLSTLP